MAKIERTKNATRNIIYGIVQNVYSVMVPFLMRTAMIYLMGVQYLGLNSLFTSVLSVLNLAELGVGAAMTFSMYKPIAEDDTDKICALMRLYRTYYRVIGLVIAVVGGVLTPFIPQLIKGTIPAELNIYILYLLNLGVTVMSYWLFAYKNCLIIAHQRNDINSKISMITCTIQYVAQFLVLWLARNYYLYIIIAMMAQVLANVITAMCANRLYPSFKPCGTLDKQEVQKINQKVRDLFTSKIGSVIYNSVDTIVISAFLGITVLAIYQNYFYILNAVYGVVIILFGACRAGVGNSLIVETKEKNFTDFQKFTFIITWIAVFCTTCLICLYQPFMELWVGKDLMLSFSAVICFATYFFVRLYNQLFNMYKDAAGMWHEDRFRPLIASLTNLILNLILVQFIGIYGVLLSTVISIVCVGIPWILHNLFTVVFERENLFPFLRKIGTYCISAIVIITLTYWVCYTITLPLIPTLMVRAFICCILPNVMLYLLFRNTAEYSQSLSLANVITKGKLAPLFKILGLRD